MDHDAVINGMIAGGTFNRLVFILEDHNRISRLFLGNKSPVTKQEFKIHHAVFQLIAGLQIVCPKGERPHGVKIIKNHEGSYPPSLQKVCHIVGDLFRKDLAASHQERAIAWHAIEAAVEDLRGLGYQAFANAVSFYVLAHRPTAPTASSEHPTRPVWKSFMFHPDLPAKLVLSPAG